MFCVFQEVSESSTGGIESLLWWTCNRPKRIEDVRSKQRSANKQLVRFSVKISDYRLQNCKISTGIYPLTFREIHSGWWHKSHHFGFVCHHGGFEMKQCVTVVQWPHQSLIAIQLMCILFAEVKMPSKQVRTETSCSKGLTEHHQGVKAVIDWRECSTNC